MILEWYCSFKKIEKYFKESFFTSKEEDFVKWNIEVKWFERSHSGIHSDIYDWETSWNVDNEVTDLHSVWTQGVQYESVSQY